jgi:phosphoribosylformylglycinamidine synthase subunit PurL
MPVEPLVNPATTPETAKKLGLLPEEFDRIVANLGRVPNFTELSVYAVMWSEHCSYKNSIKWLKQLPRTGKRVLAAAGEENAGLLDIGDGLATAFKIESHNHPSAIEPYQGAATGVGGIHRDIFTMGARPIGALNSLRFGDLSLPKTRHLLRGVVKGIGDYGNSFGIPTVGGELFFDPCYNTNPLVNAMSVGIADKSKTASATAAGLGSPVFIVGSATGKDGIHGATFASEDISAASSEKLPAVQVGDPFTEKLLLEATLEVIAQDLIIGIQDMGAAGIACSTSEMSAKGGVGMDLWLDKVPLRQAGMVPFEILLSESQERMLIVCKPGKEAQLQAIFDKWDLACAHIGTVTDTLKLCYYWHGELVGEITADTLVLGGGAPQYDREATEPAYFTHIRAFDPTTIKQPLDCPAVARFLLAHPNIAHKGWVRRQYDSTVGAATITSNTVADAALVHIHGTKKALGMVIDCNPRYVFSDPERGTALAVAEAARNLACTGAEPLGVTNCLNFGNPYNPEVYWQFTQAILGMKAACEAFDIPVTGGNVSFYNQGPDGPVFPTPSIGMVGLVEDVAHTLDIAFKQEQDLIFLLGPSTDDIACSEYLYSFLGIAYSPAPYLDLALEHRLQQLLLKLIPTGMLRSAHDVSDGGLLITLLESAFAGRLGFSITTRPGIRKDAYLFGEGGGRVVVTVREADADDLKKSCAKLDIQFDQLGRVGGETALIDAEDFGSLTELETLYRTSLEARIVAL